MPHREANSGINGALCLRRVGLQSTLPKIGDIFSLNTGTTVVGRNPATSDIFLDSAVHKALISRLHARITTHPDSRRVTICDTSLNGTYVNDRKILDTEEMQLGDVVTFGHLKGAVLEPGTVAKQHNSEFRFKLDLYPSPDNNNNGGVSYNAREMQDFLPDLSPFLHSTEEDNNYIESHLQSTSQIQDKITDREIDIKKSSDDIIQIVDSGDDSDEILPKVTIRSIPVEYIEDSDDGDDESSCHDNAIHNQIALNNPDNGYNGNNVNGDCDALESSYKNSSVNHRMGETFTKAGQKDSLSMNPCTANFTNQTETIVNNSITTNTDHDYACKIGNNIADERPFKSNEITYCNGNHKQSTIQNDAIIFNNEMETLAKQPMTSTMDPLDVECDDDELVAYAIALQDKLDDDLSDSELFSVDVPTQKVDSSSGSTPQTSSASYDLSNGNGSASTQQTGFTSYDLTNGNGSASTPQTGFTSYDLTHDNSGVSTKNSFTSYDLTNGNGSASTSQTSFTSYGLTNGNGSASTPQTGFTSYDLTHDNSGVSTKNSFTSYDLTNGNGSASTSQTSFTSYDLTRGEGSVHASTSQTSLTSNDGDSQSKGRCTSPSRASFYFREESGGNCNLALAIDTYNTEGASSKQRKRGRPRKNKQTTSKVPRNSKAVTKQKNDTPRIPKSNEKNVPETCGFLGDCLRPHDTQEYVEWVQCDFCKKWYHVECTGLSLDTVNSNAVKFNCGCVYGS